MRLLKRPLSRLMALSCVLMVLPTLAVGQAGGTASPEVAIPETAAGKIFAAWLESFNSGERAKIEGFQAAHLPKAENSSRRVDRALGLRQQTGGFELKTIERSTANEISGVIKEKNSTNLARFTLSVAPGDSGQIDNFGIELISAPAAPDTKPVERIPAKQLTEEVDARLAQLTAQDKFSGAALVAKDGKVIWQKAYGYADREAKVPNTLETRFRLGSMNKMFTSVAIAQLVQQGKLKYTDTLAKVLPDYPNQEVGKKITIDQLLTHTSGLGDFFGPEFQQKRESLHELKDYLPLFVNKPLRFEPGKDWSYSNAGFLVLGLVVEKLSGQSYYDYVQKHIYEVAGMKSSGSFPISEKVPNLATGYTHEDDAGPLKPNTSTLPWRGSSAGGGDSTLGDLLKFDQALRHNKLVNAELTNTIITGKVNPPRFPPHEKYAYGFGDKTSAGDRVVGHNGGAPGMNAELDMHWNTGYTVVVLSNVDPPEATKWARYISDRLPVTEEKSGR
ncbi:MAG TPA: serine hydrolase domain-containing protein [Candidatus Angelobacter sp.]|nr:serine hydrolase domain-containing protein [Candidatus Angelobacter sp.]